MYISNVCIYIYIYIYTHTYIYTYIYIYIRVSQGSRKQPTGLLLAVRGDQTKNTNNNGPTSVVSFVALSFFYCYF